MVGTRRFLHRRSLRRPPRLNPRRGNHRRFRKDLLLRRVLTIAEVLSTGLVVSVIFSAFVWLALTA